MGGASLEASETIAIIICVGSEYITSTGLRGKKCPDFEFETSALSVLVMVWHPLMQLPFQVLNSFSLVPALGVGADIAVVFDVLGLRLHW